MAVPKRKHAKGRTRKRRAHDALTPPTIMACPECGEPTQTHMACPSCGSYNGRKIKPIKEEE